MDTPTGRLRDDDLDRLREHADIVTVIGDTVALRRAGGDSMKGLCPFHDERSPSFHVTPSRGVWHCFGCGEGGDTIGFVEKIEQVTFREAALIVARMCGIQVRIDETASPASNARQRHLELLDRAQAALVVGLSAPEASAARRVLADRGFTREHATAHGCGYATPGMVDALVKAGAQPDDLIAVGLAIRGRDGSLRQFFRNRLTWPIRDPRGRVVGFGARILDGDGPKYLNSPESPLYRKSRALYGLHHARKSAQKTGRLFVTEGYTDVMAAWAAGFDETVATCGTALTADHLSAIHRACPDADLIVCFDGDDAGIRATRKAFTAASHRLASTRAVRFEPGTDPCDLWRNGGDAALREALDNSRPLTAVVLDDTIDCHAPDDSPENKSLTVTAVADLLGQIGDDVLRDDYAARLRHRLRLPEGSLRLSAPQPAPEPEVKGTTSTGSDLQALEKRVLARLATSPTAAAHWLPLFPPDLFGLAASQGVASVMRECAARLSAETTEKEWASWLLAEAPDDVRPALSVLLNAASDPVDTEALLSHGERELTIARIGDEITHARTLLRNCTDDTETDRLLSEIEAMHEAIKARRQGPTNR